MYFDRRSRRAYRRGMRRRGGIFGFPWFLFVLIIIFSHSLVGVLFAIAAAVILTAILMRVFGSQGMMGGNYQQPPQQPYYQPPQQPYESSPYQQPYQPPQETPVYQPYDQGYQPTPEAYQEGGTQHPYPQQNDPYQQYEQPQAQYPEEMPPMQQ
jgi:hypothetical protein